MDFQNKKISIIGFGKSGKAAAKRLLQAGAIIKVSDVGAPHAAPVSVGAQHVAPVGADGRPPAACLPVRQGRAGLPVHKQNDPFYNWADAIEFERGSHTFDFIRDSDLIVVSPGVHPDIPALEQAKAAGIHIISEVELAFRFIKKPIIAITGTNGKTTTTALTGEMFRRARYRVAVAGNIGEPLIEVDDKDLDYVIAEISSYQLEGIDKFRPYVSVILNLTPDHMERYKTMEAYASAKKRIFENQVPSDHLIFNADDQAVSEMVKEAAAQKHPFSRKTPVLNGLFLNSGYLARLNENYLEAVAGIKNIRIKGDHNIENCLAAASAAVFCGVPSSDIGKALEEFTGVEHRIEHVRTINGVDFINDSKATNPDSTIVALRTVSKGNDIVLILGGKDKGTDLGEMCGEIAGRVKAAVLIGEAADRFDRALKASGFVNIKRASSLEEAVHASFSISDSGDKVLLSPACASFDMFKDYEDRGRSFKKIVMEIK